MAEMGPLLGVCQGVPQTSVSTEGRSGEEVRETVKTCKVGLSYHLRQGSSPHSRQE